MKKDGVFVKSAMLFEKLADFQQRQYPQRTTDGRPPRRLLGAARSQGRISIRCWCPSRWNASSTV
jgi:hypothetical protein